MLYVATSGLLSCLHSWFKGKLITRHVFIYLKTEKVVKTYGFGWLITWLPSKFERFLVVVVLAVNT